MFTLTLVSITFRGVRYSRFINAKRLDNGEVVIDTQYLENWLDSLGVRRGDTYSMG